MKIRILLFFVFINSTIFSENAFWGEIKIIPEQPFIYYYVDADGYLALYENHVFNYIAKKNIFLKDGFFLTRNHTNKKNASQLSILEGKGIVTTVKWYYPWDWKRKERHNTEIIQQYGTDYTVDEWLKVKKQKCIDKDKWNQIVLYEDGINCIKASSFYEENTSNSVISYEPNGLMGRLFWVTADDYIELNYDSITPPWVEGVEGYGIGEYLDVEFKYASDEIQILNGFVDFGRMHLYKDNSRVKRILIESEEPAFTQEYELEDVVRYNVITLPKKTTKIRMTILDVYPGRKWKDTCISSILVTDPDQPPYEEQKAKIIALMKENGVWEEIEEFKKKLRDEAQ